MSTEEYTEETLDRYLALLKQSLDKINDPKEKISQVKSAIFVAENYSSDKEISKLFALLKLSQDSEEQLIIKNKIYELSPSTHPNRINLSEVYFVNFGAGIGHEINGIKPSIILGKCKSIWQVAPLTTRPQPFGENNITLQIEGLPDKYANKKLYVILNQIRNVNPRRIILIKGPKQPPTVDLSLVSEIRQKYSTLFDCSSLEKDLNLPAAHLEGNAKYGRKPSVDNSNEQTRVYTFTDVGKAIQGVWKNYKNRVLPGLLNFKE